MAEEHRKFVSPVNGMANFDSRIKKQVGRSLTIGLVWLRKGSWIYKRDIENVD
jgi:hypothetical protein